MNDPINLEDQENARRVLKILKDLLVIGENSSNPIETARIPGLKKKIEELEAFIAPMGKA